MPGLPSRCAALAAPTIALARFAAPSALARTWEGDGADGKWSTADNWQLSIPPQIDEDILFPAAAASTVSEHDFSGTPRFFSITIPGSGYEITGQPLAVTNGIIASNATGANTMGVRLDTSATQTFQSANAGTTLRITKGPPSSTSLNLNGRDLVVSGAGDMEILGVTLGTRNITKIGPGMLTINGAEDISQGVTTVSDGVLRITGGTRARVVAVTGGRLESATSASTGGLGAAGGVVAPGDAAGPSGTDQLPAEGNVNIGRCRLSPGRHRMLSRAVDRTGRRSAQRTSFIRVVASSGRR